MRRGIIRSLDGAFSQRFNRKFSQASASLYLPIGKYPSPLGGRKLAMTCEILREANTFAANYLRKLAKTCG